MVTDNIGISAALSGASQKAKRSVVDNIATFSGGIIMIFGVAQLAGPAPLHLFIGMGSEAGAYIVGAQWTVFGILLILGGALPIRPLATYAAEFLLLGSICAVAILFFQQTGFLAIAVQVIIGGLAFASSSSVRLADRAQMKRQLKYISANSNQHQKTKENSDEGILNAK